jgi:hypothetical protein
MKIFSQRSSSYFLREDSHQYGLPAQYFRASSLISPFRGQFFTEGKTTESFAVVGVDEFSVQHYLSTDKDCV